MDVAVRDLAVTEWALNISRASLSVLLLVQLPDLLGHASRPRGLPLLGRGLAMGGGGGVSRHQALVLVPRTFVAVGADL